MTGVITQDPPLPTVSGPRGELVGYAFMIGSSASFALMGSVVKLATHTLSFQEVAFFRALGSLVLLSIWVGARRIPLSFHQPAPLIWRGVIGMSAMTLYFYAISKLYMADAVLLNYTSPFFTVLVAAGVLGEALTPVTIASVAVATLGVACVVGPQGAWANWGAAAGLASGFLSALAYVAVKKATRTHSPYSIVIAFSGIAALMGLPLMIGHFRWPAGIEIWLLLGAAASASIAQVTMTYGYMLARASRAGIITLFTPLFAALLGIAFFNDQPTWGTWLGAFLILAAGVGLALKDREPKLASNLPAA